MLPSPHVLCEYLSTYSFDDRDLKMNGARFSAKIKGPSKFVC